MFQMSHCDREAVMCEGALWAAAEALRNTDRTYIGEFAPRLESIIESIQTLARELRDYNDQFETEDD